MRYTEYNEVVNDEFTYITISEDLRNGKSVVIGWTDEKYDHRDILFTYKPQKYGVLQRGMKVNYLYVSIIDGNTMGFNIENTKHNNYIIEKLRLGENECSNKICELINGIIRHLGAIY